MNRKTHRDVYIGAGLLLVSAAFLIYGWTSIAARDAKILPCFLLAVMCVLSASIIVKGVRATKEAEAAAEAKRKSACEEMAKLDTVFAEKTESEKRRIEKSSRNNIEMENRRTALVLREQVITDSIQAAAEKVKAFASSPRYKDVLRLLLTEAVYGIGKPDLIVSISAAEADAVTQPVLNQWAQELSKEIGVPLKLELAPLRLRKQGIMLSDREGRVVYDNLFETRLIRYQSEIRKAVSLVISRS